MDVELALSMPYKELTNQNPKPHHKTTANAAPIATTAMVPLTSLMLQTVSVFHAAYMGSEKFLKIILKKILNKFLKIILKKIP